VSGARLLQVQVRAGSEAEEQQITIREIKFRPKIAQNDYDTKKGHVRRFLKGRDRVKVTIMFRGREVTHPERGTALLDKLATELADVAIVEQTPLQDGRNMTMMLAPSKSVLADEAEKDGAAPEAGADGSAASAGTEAGPTEASGADAGSAEPSSSEPGSSEPGSTEPSSSEATSDNGHQNGAADEAAPTPSDATA
jgi:translation initiation factor IF-3